MSRGIVPGAGAHPPATGTTCTFVVDPLTRRACRIGVHEDVCRINRNVSVRDAIVRLEGMAKRLPRQTTIAFPQRGGARRGAGRKPKGTKPGVRHVARGSLGGSIPTLITMKILSGVANLRTRRRARAVLESLRRACARFETRITEFSIQHDHVHLIVETANERMLARAMKGLAVRIARAVNRSLGRRGAVFADRFHHRTLATPRQVRNALAYVLCNARKHRVAPPNRDWLDPLSSAPSFDGWVNTVELAARSGNTAPRTWLLRVGWRRGGLLDPAYVPNALA